MMREPRTIVEDFGNFTVQTVNRQIKESLWEKGSDVETILKQLKKDYSPDKLKAFALSRRQYDRSTLVEGIILLALMGIAIIWLCFIEMQFFKNCSIILLLTLIQVVIWSVLNWKEVKANQRNNQRNYQKYYQIIEEIESERK